MTVSPCQIVHAASGWGALELQREAAAQDKALPASMCFPKSSLGTQQYPWLALLENGILPEADPEEIPASWMISPEWKALVEESLDRPGGRTWYSLLHYGNMLFEHWDNAHTAPIAMHWPEKDKYEALAEKAWLESIDLAPNAWAYRNLAVLEHLRGNEEQAEAYYDKVFTFAVSKKDPAFAAEYMAWLSKAKKYEKAWKLYESLPEAIQTTDRMMLVAAKTGIRMRKLDFVKAVFEREYADIREGENSLTDLWFEYCALQMAKERGIENPDQETIQALCDEAWDTCPPPHAIDFRMSYDKKNDGEVNDFSVFFICCYSLRYSVPSCSPPKERLSLKESPSLSPARRSFTSIRPKPESCRARMHRSPISSDHAVTAHCAGAPASFARPISCAPQPSKVRVVPFCMESTAFTLPPAREISAFFTGPSAKLHVPAMAAAPAAGAETGEARARFSHRSRSAERAFSFSGRASAAILPISVS